MTPFDDYANHDALGLAELVRSGQVHPLELVEAAIAHIERHNPQLNAVIDTLFDRARQLANQPLPDGPFAGVPYLLKDMVVHAGTRLTLGSRLVQAARFVPDHSHEVVARSERAGLIIVGKTNACEFGLLPITEPEAFGPTVNPWKPSHSPGGSSGGSAAAVAAGMVPMAHGNDGGGSIRIPASACGVFGFKPSRGRNPGDIHDSPDGISVEHCLSRSVRDSAALLDVTSGALPGDRWWAPPPSRPFLEEVQTEPGALRIAFTTADYCGRPAHDDCQAAVRDAAAQCEQLGHHVEEARAPIDGEAFNDAFVQLWASMAASVLSMLLDDAKKQPWVAAAARAMGDRALLALAGRIMTRSLQPPVERWTRDFADIGSSLTHGAFQLVASQLQRASYEMARFLQTYDCALTPVLARPPVPTSAYRGYDTERLKHELLAYAAYTPISNVAGLPAMSVPLYWNAQDLPIGVQFIGPFGDEATLFRLAGQLERARPWRSRQPTLAADG